MVLTFVGDKEGLQISMGIYMREYVTGFIEIRYTDERYDFD